MKVVRIYPKTNFHTFLHSDTLWGNLIYAYRILYGVDKTSELLKEFSSNIPFKVSSIFPFEILKNGNKKFSYYLPKPIMGSNIREIQNPEEMVYMKEFKKIRYVDKELFEKYLNGEIDDNLLFERFMTWQSELNKDPSERNIDIINQNKFNYKTILNSTFNLHNSIDRMSGSTLQAEDRGQLYWEEEFVNYGNVLAETKDVVPGVYFLVDAKDISLIEAPLRLLSDIGMGGNRSIGKGSFDFEIKDFSFNQPTKYNSYVSLSLFQPNQDDINIISNDNIKLFYNIITRIGKVGKDFNLKFKEKNPVQCFTEGSTFFVNHYLNGDLVPTAVYNNNHKIFSNYLFFGVKANLRLQ